MRGALLLEATLHCPCIIKLGTMARRSMPENADKSQGTY